MDGWSGGGGKGGRFGDKSVGMDRLEKREKKDD